jgi:hypothetical protein
MLGSCCACAAVETINNADTKSCLNIMIYYLTFKYIYLYDLFRYEMNTSYWAQRYVKDFKLFRFYIDNKVFFLSFKEVFFIFLHIDSE